MKARGLGLVEPRQLGPRPVVVDHGLKVYATEADYAAMLSVNIAGFFHITQLALAEMEKQGSGHIV